MTNTVDEKTEEQFSKISGGFYNMRAIFYGRASGSEQALIEELFEKAK